MVLCQNDSVYLHLQRFLRPDGTLREYFRYNFVFTDIYIMLFPKDTSTGEPMKARLRNCRNMSR
jgi:hypothetical protein